MTPYTVNEIKYQTEGKVQVDDDRGNTKPFALVWLKGSLNIQIHQGGATVHASYSQLLKLAKIAGEIAADLEPDPPLPPPPVKGDQKWKR